MEQEQRTVGAGRWGLRQAGPWTAPLWSEWRGLGWPPSPPWGHSVGQRPKQLSIGLENGGGEARPGQGEGCWGRPETPLPGLSSQSTVSAQPSPGLQQAGRCDPIAPEFSATLDAGGQCREEGVQSQHPGSLEQQGSPQAAQG